MSLKVHADCIRDLSPSAPECTHWHLIVLCFTYQTSGIGNLFILCQFNKMTWSQLSTTYCTVVSLNLQQGTIVRPECITLVVLDEVLSDSELHFFLTNNR